MPVCHTQQTPLKAPNRRETCQIWPLTTKNHRAAATEPAQYYGGVAAGTFQIGSHLGNRSVLPRSSCRYVGHGAFGFFLFERIPPMKQKVQLRALRWVPERAGVPREGRGEAPIQHIPSQNQNNSHNPPFSPGGARAAPPPRRPRPYALQ